MDVRQLVTIWVKLIDLGLVDYPGDIKLYRRSVAAAFNGSFEGVTQAIKNLRIKINSYTFEANQDPKLLKWNESTCRAWQRSCYLLSLVKQILEEYYGISHTKANKASNSSSKSSTRKGNRLVRV